MKANQILNSGGPDKKYKSEPLGENFDRITVVVVGESNSGVVADLFRRKRTVLHETFSCVKVATGEILFKHDFVFRKFISKDPSHELEVREVIDW